MPPVAFAMELRQSMLLLLLLLLLVVLAFPPAAVCQPLDAKAKVCKKIEVEAAAFLSKLSNVTDLANHLASRVNGCQVIDGDLTIRNIGMDSSFRALPWASNVSSDFLDSIVEVRGRLIVRMVTAPLSLRNLRVIRGFNPERLTPDAAIVVSGSHPPFQLRLPRLVAITKGDVELAGVAVDVHCRYSHLVDWTRLFQNARQRYNSSRRSVVLPNGTSVLANGYGEVESLCKGFGCHSSCKNHCWGGGKDSCQADNECPSGYCSSAACGVRSDGRKFCCHSNCIGGCTGTGSSDCLACKDVSNDGRCVTDCPRGEKLDPETNTLVPGDHKLQAGGLCVKSCPPRFVIDKHNRYCLSSCKNGQIPVEGRCVDCVNAHNQTCVKCNDLPRKLDAKFVEQLGSRECSVWHGKHITVEGKSLQKAWLPHLQRLKILYSKMTVRDANFVSSNLEYLSGLQLVTGNFYVMNSRLTHLGLVNLRPLKLLNIWNVTGLCSAWFPRSLPIRTSKVKFDNSSSVCLNATCHSQCLGECWGPGAGMCVTCHNVSVSGVCVKSCESVGMFGLNRSDAGVACVLCDPKCDGCTGPGPARCTRCKRYKQFDECVHECGEGLQPDAAGTCQPVMTASAKIGVSVGLGVLLLLLLLLLLGWRYFAGRLRKYNFLDPDEYLVDAKNPADMTKLLIVNNEDITKVKEIGSGAFGTVYKGKLRCDTIFGVKQLPVAVKVLHGSSPKLDKELLDEASVLARVKHPHCIRLVALCLTRQVQLITALMPRGCLLEFLRARGGCVAAERMLTWAAQVAQGMQHLQSLGILHRDLAARNVLLESLDCVRITDFGLARLVDSGFHEADRLPIRWLSVENFNGDFSHKSDVWSYGVLLWEICTYGDVPYASHRVAGCADLKKLLDSGVRLSQPDNCSVDFYNHMLTCWLPDPESRPTFDFLEQVMLDCLEKPEKYIAKCPAFDTDEQQELQLQMLPTHQVNVYSDDPTAKVNRYVSDPTNQADEEQYLVPRSPGVSGDYLQPLKA